MSLQYSDEDQQIQKRIDRIKSHIKCYPDFPKPGVIFRDIFPLFKDPTIFKDLIFILESNIQKNIPNVGAIVGLESRGFLIGTILAFQLNIPFIPIRKTGKLPGKVESCFYEMEYSSNQFEIQLDLMENITNCVIVDDLLATGGSARSAIELIKKCGANVIGVIVLIELVKLKGREKFSEPFFSLIQF